MEGHSLGGRLDSAGWYSRGLVVKAVLINCWEEVGEGHCLSRRCLRENSLDDVEHTCHSQLQLSM